MGINLINVENKTILAYSPPNNNKNVNNIGSNLEDFEVLHEMGKGGYGYIFKVKSKINSEIYVLKKITLNNLDYEEKTKFKNESFFLRKFKDQNVCKCLTSFEKDGNYYYVMDLFNCKDLYRFLEAHQQLQLKIKEEYLWDIFHQCLKGLIYIHSLGVIHRDIKLGNIFIDDKRHIQIGDFGESSIIDKNKLKEFTDKPEEQNSLFFTPEIRGTKEYMAPEVLKCEEYDQRADVYSMGLTFFTLCFYCFPDQWNKKNEYYSSDLLNIIFKMIESNQENRQNSNEIYIEFKKLYLKNYVKNSGIYSVIQCLFSFPNFKSCFSDNYNMQKIIDMKVNKKFVLIMINIIELIKDKKSIQDEIYILRNYFYEEGIKK